MELQGFINDWVDSREEELVRDISRLVAVKSVKGEAAENAPFGPGPAKAIAEAQAMCEEYGFRVTNYDNYVLTADLNDKQTNLDILGHLDVVGEGDGWDTDPYTAVRQGDLLFGRGTDDDKGPVAAALMAMRAVRESGIPLAYNCRLIMGADEESGSGDLRYYFARETSAPNTFSPDASFPVFNTEKGGYHCRLTKSWEATQALPRVTSFSGGFRINVLPAEATATVKGLDAGFVMQAGWPEAFQMGVELEAETVGDSVVIKVTGKGAHAAEPENGCNGITALIAILRSLPLADCASKQTLIQLEELLPHRDCSGKALGIAMEDAVSGPLTLSYTLMTMTETGFEGHFDSRVPVCANDENCRKVVEEKFGACGFTVEGMMGKPHHTPADTPFVKTLLKRYEDFTGEKGECLAMGGGTYVHDIDGGVAFGAGMPGFDSHLHGANERISVKNMLTACKIFAAVIADMCGA